MRSGNEPMTARSPLRLRLVLAIFGVLLGAGAAVGTALSGQVPLAILFAVIAGAACVNVAVVIIRIRQGPAYQPGRDVPPLPDEPASRSRGPYSG
jgi:hypothetical protein